MKKIAVSLVFAVGSIAVANAANPYLPLWEYIPDGEPHVFDDPDVPGEKRVYIYGSHDSRVTDFCGREQVVWSAPVDSLDRWRYDGVIFAAVTDRDGNQLNDDGLGDILYAPDVAVVHDEAGVPTYYLFPNDQADGRKGLIARSSRPDGPFEVCNWSEDNPKETYGVFGFDPSVLVDDDGRIYGYWGFEESFMAELDPATMSTVKPGTELKVRAVPGFSQDDVARFFEASSMRKIGDKYVFVYSRSTADGDFGLGSSNYTLAYAYGDTPLGPWTYGGTIIDGRGRTVLPDGTTIYTAHPNGNTHGGLCQLGGQWYIFYHRQCGLDEFSRQAMVAPVEVTVESGPGGKVTISEAEYTSEGFEINGLNPLNTYPAGIACHYTGHQPAIETGWPHKRFYGSYIQPGRHDGDPASVPADVNLRVNPVVNNVDGAVTGYKYFNFDLLDSSRPAELLLTMRPTGVKGTIEILAGDIYRDPVKLGETALGDAAGDAETTLRVPLDKIDRLHGKMPLYFRVSSPEQDASVGDMLYFRFNQ
ncbi:MAG: family 43 glycosylhydrolase [Barnesiella sp.]|nr:family 43 glycosylhydrolase [Barnesiella sp.]